MCRCAAKGCRRRIYAKGAEIGMKGGLCYKHGWWYACTNQAEYAGTCTVVFPLWSVGDVAVWLEWCGI